MYNYEPYHYEIPVPMDSPYISEDFRTIEECVASCKAKCTELNVDYDDRDVKLFMTDSDCVWEVTEEGELAG